jgi:hypothetical protein
MGIQAIEPREIDLHLISSMAAWVGSRRIDQGGKQKGADLERLFVGRLARKILRLKTGSRRRASTALTSAVAPLAAMGLIVVDATVGQNDG